MGRPAAPLQPFGLTGVESSRQTLKLTAFHGGAELKLAKAFALTVLALPAFGQYAGPAILSRGESPAAMATQQISFRPYLEVTGVYDTGLSGVSVVNAQGDLANRTAEGIDVTGGISGFHSWKHTRLGLNYRGSVREFNKATYYDTTDQFLALSLVHQFTRHVALNLQETAGMFSRSFGLIGLPQTAGYDPNSNIIPTTDFYDNRTIYFSTRADLTLQETARLSFDFGGEGFQVRRRSSDLYGMTGATARGDIQYRITRRTTIGGLYSYSHYDFTRILGGSDVHSGVITYAAALSRRWELSGFAGFARVENRFERTVPLPPEVEALLGTATGAEVTYNVAYIPNIRVRLSRTFSRGVIYAMGGREVMPGNGLFLTSSSTNFSGGYTFTGVRNWSFGINGAYARAESLGNVIGQYDTTSGGFTAARKISRVVHALASVNARRYSSPDFSKYNRPIYEMRFGLGFTPGDVPLRIW